MTNNFDIIRAREIYNSLYREEMQIGTVLTEEKEALLFAKALHMQLYGSSTVFCKDNQFFVNKTPNGYAVAGFCEDSYGTKHSFNVTVCKANGIWGLSANYVSPDTKAVTNSVALWVILMIGCSLVGLVSYLILKAIIGF